LRFAFDNPVSRVVNPSMRPRVAGIVCAALLFAGPALAQVALQERCAKGAGEDAIAACSDVIGIGSGGAEVAWAYFDRARAYFGLKLYASAIDELTEELKRKPDDVEALENRGLAFIQFGDLKHAIGDFSKVIDLQPSSARALYERCWAWAAADRELDDALGDCNKALTLRPADAATLDARCFVQFRKAAFGAAIADCSSALFASPKFASSLYLRGIAKKKSGDVIGSAADIAAAAALDPSIADTFTNYGVAQ
jgi:tetratricopeptide (TPR) repeat protein